MLVCGDEDALMVLEVTNKLVDAGAAQVLRSTCAADPAVASMQDSMKALLMAVSGYYR